MDFRTGIGYDVHALVPGRRLIIGGVEIPYTKGLDGHSDADVLLHAIMDALIGAMGKGDIGRLFPDTDDYYKGISSLKLMGEVRCLMQSCRYEIVNIDAVVIAQKPRLAPYIERMEQLISDALATSADNINIKATTEEGLGFTGEGLGIAAKAVCLIKKTQA